MFKKYILIALYLFNTGCATYHDNRTVEEQRSKLTYALSALSGNYVVKESRNNDLDVVSITITDSIDLGALVSLKSKDGRVTNLPGDNCNGYVNEKRKYIGLLCFKISDRHSYFGGFGVDKLDAPRLIKSGALIGGYEPMQAVQGDYLIEIMYNRTGRSMYFRADKK
jgi:hypothetical protein